MDIKPYLLDDEAMLHFIARGFYIVKTDVASEVHANILQDAKRVMADGNPGNDILHEAPGLHEIFKHPAMVGALSSFLGDSYTMHCHRHCHLNKAKQDGRRFHQDGSPRQFRGWSRPWRRHHRPRTVMAICYPHKTSIELGPTGVIPGTQYYNTKTENERDYEWPFVVVNPGDILLVHFDLWHRVSDNVSDQDRYMMKFLFKRTQEPIAPSWNASQDFDPNLDTLPQRLKPDHPSNALLQHPLVWDFMWRWMRGETLPDWKSDTSVSIDDTLKNLLGTNHVAALDATYSLGKMGKHAVPALMDVLLGGQEDIREKIPAALSATGSHAVDALANALTHSDDWVRATAADTLADIGLPAIDALPNIRKSLTDDNDWVRHNAANALAIWGKSADAAQSDLFNMLQDREPFVSFNALTALEHMGGIDNQVRGALKELQHHDHERLRYQINEILQHVA